jgi:oxygen-independent coproporphyrinogen-3 oxidase
MQANGKETNLVRIENVKEIGEYIRRIDEMIERKEEWLWR